MPYCKTEQIAQSNRSDVYLIVKIDDNIGIQVSKQIKQIFDFFLSMASHVTFVKPQETAACEYASFPYKLIIYTTNFHLSVTDFLLGSDQNPVSNLKQRIAWNAE